MVRPGFAQTQRATHAKCRETCHVRPTTLRAPAGVPRPVGLTAEAADAERASSRVLRVPYSVRSHRARRTVLPSGSRLSQAEYSESRYGLVMVSRVRERCTRDARGGGTRGDQPDQAGASHVALPASFFSAKEPGNYEPHVEIIGCYTTTNHHQTNISHLRSVHVALMRGRRLHPHRHSVARTLPAN